MSAGSIFAQGIINAGNAFAQPFDPKYKLDIDKMKRDLEAQRLANEQSQFTADLRREGAEKYDQYQQRVSDRDAQQQLDDTMGLDFSKMQTTTAADAPMGLQKESAVGPFSPFRFGASSPVDTGEGRKLLETTPRQMFNDMGLSAYRNVDPRIQGIADTYDTQDKMSFEEKKLGLSTMEKMARLEKARQEAAQGNADLELKLKKQVLSDPVVKDFQTIDSRFRGIAASWSEYTSMSPEERGQQSKIALDQTLVNLFNKIMDPTSVVRESEFARTAQGQALLEQVKGWLPKLKTGGTGLTDRERQEIVNAAETLYGAARQSYQKVINDYRQLMEPYPVRADVIIGSVGQEAVQAGDIGTYVEDQVQDFREPQQAQEATETIRPGTVEDGYRFMGGDPSDPNNWEKL